MRDDSYLCGDCPYATKTDDDESSFCCGWYDAVLDCDGSELYRCEACMEASEHD